ncbi:MULTISPECIES: heavy metal translocating P-type ATPase [unclassified Paenibacillus]|uniref:heavy metal translocating P-type ATPase n=1 Tax=unclassified Paenibacillus TaxID=185978 RepID=UPI00240575A8|nr:MULTISPECIES: heavy metal translocating P-type ATPase [unclassified Paenibacillus]MDF9843088.1 Cd2+/Zn2+-exporting ATPase [Paenibacillus sp. PastF-2]MDF9849700.1 Cd2+/Zn2+-exporting ATPase [Paenibacillus sp. PastM-2]MDF9856383.1 Cd2+/Zn2+-exporting ATPase [Paenibacillus sp. PastF-1]MDH6481654.1 Cd2+/Zn2+-exporting ATPase [Paenibacillus sp. PastH-2]MDH6508936.1 Cd2+/Zn2+-exporting ATPase [Paenibacillus sp. PastM-3]
MQATSKQLPKSTARQGTGQQPRAPKPRRFDPVAMLGNPEMQAALGSGLLMLIAWAASGWSEVLSIVLYVISYTVGGWIKAKEGVETLVKERDLDVNLLMIAAALGAASIGYWNEGAMLIFIFAMSGALESYTMERSKKDISALMALKPATAIRIEQGAMSEVPIDQLAVGDLLLVRPGELIPADGKVCRGESSVNQASITGESLPVEKAAGSEVFAGTVNGEGPLYIEVTTSAENTLFAKIIRMVEEAETEVPDSQRFIKRLESVYARVVVIATAALITLPPFVLDWSWSNTFYKAMVFLVVASPCALVSSIMPAMLSAISKSARKGILFKGGVHLENMAKVKVVAFDKTGTLTEGVPQVTDLITGEGYSREELLAVSASIEKLSRHPLAEAVVRLAEEEQVELYSTEENKSITGWGIEGRIDGRLWRIGRSDILDEQAPAEAAGHAQWTAARAQLESEGKTVSLILEEERIAGMIALQDTVRPQAAAAVQKLHRLGVKVAMLTGDRKAAAGVMAGKTGVDLVFADLLPEDKVTRIKELRGQYGQVVMVGDGVNDAPALATATVGIGMGMKGSGAALEIADVVLMNDNIEEIASTIELARRTQRIVKQNMIFAVTVIVTLMLSNFLQGIALPFGVVGHEGSTILVILNGLRLLR